MFFLHQWQVDGNFDGGVTWWLDSVHRQAHLCVGIADILKNIWFTLIPFCIMCYTFWCWCITLRWLILCCQKLVMCHRLCLIVQSVYVVLHSVDDFILSYYLLSEHFPLKSVKERKFTIWSVDWSWQHSVDSKITSPRKWSSTV
jgi:hypothetical protein